MCIFVKSKQTGDNSEKATAACGNKLSLKKQVHDYSEEKLRRLRKHIE